MGQIIVEKDLDGIEGLCLITPALHDDERGYFMESYSRRDMEEAGFNISFVQDNQSMSTKGVLRGLHFQTEHPQTKLVRVLRGEVFDVAVDLRKGSKTFGKWHGEILSEDNRKQFLIPRGFAHGFLVLSDVAIFLYKCDEFFYANDRGGIAWNDPGIGIHWPGVTGEYKGTASADGYRLDGIELIMSEKDQCSMGFEEFCSVPDMD
ncbi:MAG: dTDP-4-dehydrorhamnose 3,5-epimerase [Lachnospiraceae bacterium]|nr:dTDP-4-dehydrorhamnose 3,5-epimerase [Lachnospiraceae bacterium]